MPPKFDFEIQEKQITLPLNITNFNVKDAYDIAHACLHTES